MSNMLLINGGNGTFTHRDLVPKCQAGPIKAFYVHDFNSDGNPDFLYGGNHLPTEVETARYDGLYPGICYGDGKGNFDCKTIFINGQLRIDDIRDIKVIKSKGVDVIMFANNNGPLRTYTLK